MTNTRIERLENRLPESRDALPADVERVLLRMDRTVDDLLSRNKEHRVVDFWDQLPIIASFRSHRVAKDEAQLVDHLRQDMAELERMGAGNAELKAAVEAIGQPGGVSMVAASILPSVRTFHRGIVVYKPERLKRILRTMLRGDTDQRRAA